MNLKSVYLPKNKVRLYFEISDSGIGMNESQVKALFKPFSQADSSTVRKYGGTGLGLSISKAIVEEMEGEIAVSSVPDAGSTFSFDVLMDIGKESDVRGDEESFKSFEGDFKGIKALLAEDNEINQEIALAVLDDFGITADVADNGEKAVEAFCENKYDVIFMDIRMPIMDGLQATQKIREIEKSRNTGERIPIIAMTANAMVEDRRASKEAGMDAHVSKPIDLNEINETIVRIIKGKKT